MFFSKFQDSSFKVQSSKFWVQKYYFLQHFYIPHIKNMFPHCKNVTGLRFLNGYFGGGKNLIFNMLNKCLIFVLL